MSKQTQTSDFHLTTTNVNGYVVKYLLSFDLVKT